MEHELTELGLTRVEAKAYLQVLRHAGLTGAQVAEAIGVPRSSAYAALRSLAEMGLVESGHGYGSKFRVIAPEKSLPLLIDREREELVARETLAKEIAQRLGELTDSGDELEEVVEVLRSQRAVADRHERLLVDVQRSIHVFVKAPIVATRPGNPAEHEALGRGVQTYALYEEAVLDDEQIAPYVRQWVSAGEEARLFPGELPFKLALYDGRNALMPLETPGQTRPYTSILIRNDALGRGLRMLFDRLWAEARPLDG